MTFFSFVKYFSYIACEHILRMPFIKRKIIERNLKNESYELFLIMRILYLVTQNYFAATVDIKQNYINPKNMITNKDFLEIILLEISSKFSVCSYHLIKLTSIPSVQRRTVILNTSVFILIIRIVIVFILPIDSFVDHINEQKMKNLSDISAYTDASN